MATGHTLNYTIELKKNWCVFFVKDVEWEEKDESKCIKKGWGSKKKNA